jgi:hypothetical protein
MYPVLSFSFFVFSPIQEHKQVLLPISMHKHPSAGRRLISFHVTALESARLARLTCAAFNIRLATHKICAGHGSSNAGTCEKLHNRSRIQIRQKAGVCASGLRMKSWTKFSIYKTL